MLHPSVSDLKVLIAGAALGASIVLSALALRMLALARDALNRAARETRRLSALAEAIVVFRQGGSLDRLHVVRDDPRVL